MSLRWFGKGKDSKQAQPLDLVIDYDKCHECGGCIAVCPPDALFLGAKLTVNQETCTDCDRCVKMCPVHALSLVPVTDIAGGAQ